MEASKITEIPLRTFKTYENDKSKVGTLKYNYILDKLTKYSYIDEEHGILTIDNIIKATSEVFSKYNVDYCYLFGSYAKNKATETSDVDLLISTSITGVTFFGLIEELREKLKKKIDLLTIKDLDSNVSLANEILKDGIKIYG